jgi:1,2-dihydroxy-3-keto-5-methylthiopentene dioxygenase
MTTLSIYAADDGRRPLLTTCDPAEIRQRLATIGVEFERWRTEVEVSGADPPESILGAYGQWLEDLKRRGGYATADVISLTPHHPDKVALREKFLREHIHTEDEVRFFVAGRGAFYLHVGEQVNAVICERGDLLRVPANTPHWFDTGPSPNLVAIRVFTNPQGWVAQYTGQAIAARFPRLEPGGLPLG